MTTRSLLPRSSWRLRNRTTKPRPTVLFAFAVTIIACLAAVLTASGDSGKLYLRLSLTTSAPGLAKAYFDTGSGFSECSAERLAIRDADTALNLDFPIPRRSVRGIRVDPLDRPGTVALRGVQVVDAAGRTVRPLPLSALLPASGLDVQRTTDELTLSSAQAGADPQFSLPADLLGGVRATNRGSAFFSLVWWRIGLVLLLGLGLFVLVTTVRARRTLAEGEHPVYGSGEKLPLAVGNRELSWGRVRIDQ